MDWLIALLGFSLPFERLGAVSFGGVTGLTIRLSQILVGILLLIWLIRGVAGKSIKPKPLFIAWAMAGYLAVGLLSLINADDWRRGLMVWLFIVVTMLSTVVIVNVIDTPGRLKLFIKAIIAGAIVVCLFGLWQFLGDLAGMLTSLTGLRELYTKEVFGFPRIQSTALEPLLFANYLLIPLFLLAGMIISNKFWLGRKWSYLFLILLLINFILTLSRGGYLGLAVGGLVLAIICRQRFFQWKSIKPIFIGLAVVILAGTAFFRWTAFGEKSWDLVSRHFGQITEDASVAHRWLTYEKAWDGFREKPLFGIGLGNFSNYYNDGGSSGSGWQTVNNQYLETLTETGVFGFLFLFFIFGGALAMGIIALKKTADKNLKLILAGELAALAGILVQYNFFSTLYVIHIWLLIGLLFATLNLINKAKIKN